MAETKLVALTPAEARRLSVYTSMTKKLQLVADTMEKQITVESTGILTVRWLMGAKIRQVIEQEQEFGVNAVEQLAEYLGCTATDLYNMRTVATEFTREQIAELGKRRMQNGQHLNYTHALTLAQLSAVDRPKYLERTLVESLSSNALATVVAGEAEKRHKRQGGRKPARPGSPAAAAQQAAEQLLTLANRIPIWDQVLLDRLDEMSPPEIGQVLGVKVKLALERAIKVQEKLELFVTRLTAGAERIDRVESARSKKDEIKDKKKA